MTPAFALQTPIQDKHIQCLRLSKPSLLPHASQATPARFKSLCQLRPVVSYASGIDGWRLTDWPRHLSDSLVWVRLNPSACVEALSRGPNRAGVACTGRRCTRSWHVAVPRIVRRRHGASRRRCVLSWPHWLLRLAIIHHGWSWGWRRYDRLLSSRWLFPLADAEEEDEHQHNAYNSKSTDYTSDNGTNRRT